MKKINILGIIIIMLIASCGNPGETKNDPFFIPEVNESTISMEDPGDYTISFTLNGKTENYIFNGSHYGYNGTDGIIDNSGSRYNVPDGSNLGFDRLTFDIVFENEEPVYGLLTKDDLNYNVIESYKVSCDIYYDDNSNLAKVDFYGNNIEGSAHIWLFRDRLPVRYIKSNINNINFLTLNDKSLYKLFIYDTNDSIISTITKRFTFTGEGQIFINYNNEIINPFSTYKYANMFIDINDNDIKDSGDYDSNTSIITYDGTSDEIIIPTFNQWTVVP